MRANDRRPLGVTLITVFLCICVLICAASVASLLLPGSWLEPMWRIKPDARSDFASMGVGGIALLVVVGIMCAVSAFGLSRRRRWGHRMAVVGLALNAASDAIRGFWDPRALVGVLIVAAIIAYLLSADVRRWFNRR